MQKFLLLLLAFFAFLSTYAQVAPSPSAFTGTIQGIAVDSADQSILSYATVVLKETGHSQAFKTSITDQRGAFLFTDLPEKSYTLTISYLGYQSKTIALPPFSSPVLQLHPIKLSALIAQLQEIVVVAQRLLVEQELDKLTYHVEMDPESHTLSALEMLGRVPLLALDGDDNLLLNGSSSYQVRINGKTSSLFVQNPGDVLKTMPASTIKSIEVITNPPARYDAEGLGGIINIITHSKTIRGYNGALNASLSSPQGWGMGAYLTAKTGKIGFSGQGSHSNITNPSAGRHFNREDYIRETRLEQNGESNSRNSARFAGGELTYEPGALHLLSIGYRTNNSNGTHGFTQLGQLLNGSGEQLQAYRNVNNGSNRSSSSDLSFDYQRSFRKRTEQLLSFSYKLGNNRHASSSDFALEGLLNYTGRLSQTENENSSQEHSLQADYVQPIKKHSLEVGVKSSLRRHRSDYHTSTYQQESAAFVSDPLLSNSFDYRQDIHAAYASLNLKKKNWGLRAGVRLEQTRIDANFRSSGTIARPQYLNPIPNLSLSHRLQGSSTLRLSYTQRLERPGLYHLNPYADLTDPRNISYGNPALDPATNHSFHLAYATYIGSTSVNAGFFHHFTNNSIQRFTTLGEDTVARTTYANIGRRQTWGLSLGGSTTLFKKLSLNVNSTTQYFNLSSTGKDRLQHNAGLTLNASGNASYRFNKSWRASGSIAYTSPQILLQGRSAGFVSNNLSLNKEFLKQNKGSLSLSVRNPFQKYRRFQSEVNDPAFYQLQESFSVIRQYSLGFNYRFGKVQAGSARRKRSSASDHSSVAD